MNQTPDHTAATAEGRWPVLTAMICQVIAGGLVLAATRALAQFGHDVPVAAIAAAQGLLAALIGRGFRLDWWWAPVHIALPFAFWGLMALELPAWLYLLLFVALVMVFNGAAGDRVPLYLTNRATEARLGQLLPEGRPFKFIDLGCGLGGPLKRLARGHASGEFEGVEAAPLTFAIAWLRCLGTANARVRLGDFRHADLSRFDVVYCFLSPQPMTGLYNKALREMKPGAVLISNSFAVPGHDADDVVAVADRRATRLYRWLIR